MIARVLLVVLASSCLSGLCWAEDRDTTSANSANSPARESKQVGFGLSAGFGIGSRAFVLPTHAGVQRLADSPFAVADFNLTFRAGTGRRLDWHVSAAYQTSIAWRLEQQPLFALPQTIDARSQRFEISLVPVVRLGDSSTAPAIAFPLGFGLRSFWPRLQQFPVHDYVLGGPQLRVELRLMLGSRVGVRVSPELQWLIVTNPALRALGVSSVSGFAVGAEAALEASLDATFRVAIAYRESRAYVPSQTFQLEDTERYLTARIAGEL